MAVGFDPKRTYELSLDLFTDLPATERPSFVYRRINGREYTELAKVHELEGRKLWEDADALYAALRIGLVDWKRQVDPSTGNEVPFDLEKLCDVMDPVEAFELVNKRLYGARLTAGEQKNSA